MTQRKRDVESLAAPTVPRARMPTSVASGGGQRRSALITAAVRPNHEAGGLEQHGDLSGSGMHGRHFEPVAPHMVMAVGEVKCVIVSIPNGCSSYPIIPNVICSKVP